MSRFKTIFVVLAFILLLLGTAVAGWYFGFRDGVTYAYGDMSSSLETYHLAHQRQDVQTAHRAIDRYTGEVVAHLLNGRYGFPPTPLSIASRSDYSLSKLRAAWTPSRDSFVTATRFFHAPKRRDFRADFMTITPSPNTNYVTRYAD